MINENYLIKQSSQPLTRTKKRLTEAESQHELCTIPKKRKTGGKMIYPQLRCRYCGTRTRHQCICNNSKGVCINCFSKHLFDDMNT